jgi:hypothetical protein
MFSVPFDETPDRLITLPQAADETGIPLDRLRSWRKTRHLVPIGKLRGDAPNGGVLLFRFTDVLRLLEDPPPRGRRPKEKGGRR